MNLVKVFFTFKLLCIACFAALFTVRCSEVSVSKFLKQQTGFEGVSEQHCNKLVQHCDKLLRLNGGQGFSQLSPLQNKEECKCAFNVVIELSKRTMVELVDNNATCSIVDNSAEGQKKYWHDLLIAQNSKQESSTDDKNKRELSQSQQDKQTELHEQLEDLKKRTQCVLGNKSLLTGIESLTTSVQDHISKQVKKLKKLGKSDEKPNPVSLSTPNSPVVSQ